jgi:ketopantoate reductase
VQILTRTGAHYRETAPAHRMSALQDVEAGRPLEVNETLGYALEKSLQLGLELPLLDCFRHLIGAIDRSARPAG